MVIECSAPRAMGGRVDVPIVTQEREPLGPTVTYHTARSAWGEGSAEGCPLPRLLHLTWRWGVGMTCVILWTHHETLRGQ